MRNQVFSINQGRQTKAQLVSIHKAHETRKHAGNWASSFPLHGLLPLRITLPLSLETFVRNLGELSDSAASLYGVDFLSLVVYAERGTTEFRYLLFLISLETHAVSKIAVQCFLFFHTLANTVSYLSTHILTTVNTGKQPKHLLTWEWIRKCGINIQWNIIQCWEVKGREGF